MALIVCPECGKQISNKASVCPNCGYPIQEHQHTDESNFKLMENEFTETTDTTTVEKSSETEVPPEINEATQEEISNNDKTSQAGTNWFQAKILSEQGKKKYIIAAAVILVGLCAAMILGTSPKKLQVDDISISKWRVMENGSYFDTYEATIDSNQKKPFVATIGSYENQESFPQMVYMNEGIGKLDAMVDSDDDPSSTYYVNGYCVGKQAKSSKIKCSYTLYDYTDYSSLEETSCSADIDVQCDNSFTGVVLADIENDVNGNVEHNIPIEVENGIGSHKTYISKLPLKSRGMNLTITPTVLLTSKNLTEKDYSVDENFSVKKEEGEYFDSYKGSGIWKFNDISDGYILYSQTLIDGGDKAEQGKEDILCSFMRDGKCKISTYDTDTEDTMRMPKYEFKIIGYIPWTSLEKIESTT